MIVFDRLATIKD